jgi:molybdopterin converting factor subunit 1
VKVRVKLFAVAKERIGRESIEVDLPSAPTVASLRSAIVEQYPPLGDVIRHTRFAVNSQYAADTTPILPSAEIAVIPPVSGG